MSIRQGSRRVIAIAVWWVGVAVATTLLLAHPHLRGPVVDLASRTPFDNTRSGHAEQWAFLRAAAVHVPRGASFTVVAPDGDTEMSLYMMAVGLLPQAHPLPSSYYGHAVEAGDNARFVLEFSERHDPLPGHTQVTPLPGGRLIERRAHRP